MPPAPARAWQHGRTDCPDGLVGDDRLGDVLFANALPAKSYLLADEGQRIARITHIKVLATAHDGMKPLGKQCLDLLVDRLVGLAKILAALRMPDNAVFAGELFEHGDRNGAGIGSVGLPIHVLGTKLDARVVKGENVED